MRKICLLFCMLVLSVLLVSCASSQPEASTTTQPDVPTTTQPPVYTTRQWTPIYNAHSCGFMAQWADRECASTKELTTEEILSVLPGKRLENVTYGGHADFREDGSVLRVRFRVYRDDLDVYIAMGSDTKFFACCISRDSDAVECSCGDMKYKIYKKDGIIFAETVWNEIPLFVSVRSKIVTTQEDGMEVLDKEDIEKYKTFFEEVLECLSWYRSDEPAFTAITPAES